MKIVFLTILVLPFLCFTSEVQAQFNIKIGYGFSYTNPKVNNAIIGRYNDSNAFLDNELEELHYLHGMILGIRYRIEDVAVEAAWDNKFSTLKAGGRDLNTDDSVFRELLFRHSSYSLGLEGYLNESFGIGASIDLDNIRYRTDVSGVDSRYTVTSAWGLGSQFHLSINIPGNDILTLSLKPFVQIPWWEMNVFQLENELNPLLNPNIDEADYKEQYFNFGIKLVFYNGVW